MTEKDANKNPIEPDPKDVSAGGTAPGTHQVTAPQSAFASSVPSQEPSKVEPGLDPNDNVAAGGTAPGTDQVSAPPNEFSTGPPATQVEPVAPDNVAAGGTAPGTDQVTAPPNEFSTGPPATQVEPVAPDNVAAGGTAPGTDQVTAPPNEFSTGPPATQVEPVSPDNVAAGGIAPTASQVDAGPKIISTPLDPKLLGPEVSQIDPGASQGDDDVAAGAAGPQLGTGDNPAIRVRVNDADLTAPDEHTLHTGD